MAIDFSQFETLTPEERTKELRKLIEELRNALNQVTSNERKHVQQDLNHAEHLLTIAQEELLALEIQEQHAQEPKQNEHEETSTETPLEQRAIPEPPRDELEHRLHATHAEETALHLAEQPRTELYQRLHALYEQPNPLQDERLREEIYAIRESLDRQNERQHETYAKERHRMTGAEEINEQYKN